MAARIITLTTDFGTADGFPAAMRGVILGLAPDMHVVDLTHEVPPQDVAHASFVLCAALPFWQTSTVHVAVVDPGVGTERKALVIEGPGGRILIGPDNGIFSHLLAGPGPAPGSSHERPFLGRYRGKVPEGVRAFSIENRAFMLERVSQTFHGRDVFAPAAARIAAGAAPAEVGPRVDQIAWLNLPGPKRDGPRLSGHVQYVDRFGNLVTDIAADSFPERDPAGGFARAEIRGRMIPQMSESYADAPGLGCVIGSHNFLEVFQPNDSAARTLGATVGTPLRVHLRPA